MFLEISLIFLKKEDKVPCRAVLHVILISVDTWLQKVAILK